MFFLILLGLIVASTVGALFSGSRGVGPSGWVGFTSAARPARVMPAAARICCAAAGTDCVMRVLAPGQIAFEVMP